VKRLGIFQERQYSSEVIIVFFTSEYMMWEHKTNIVVEVVMSIKSYIDMQYVVSRATTNDLQLYVYSSQVVRTVRTVRQYTGMSRAGYLDVRVSCVIDFFLLVNCCWLQEEKDSILPMTGHRCT